MKRSLKHILSGTMVLALIVPGVAAAQVQNQTQTQQRPSKTRPATKPTPARQRPATTRPATKPTPTRPRPGATRPVTKPTPTRPRPGTTRPVTKPAPTRPVTRPPHANRPIVQPTRPVVRPTRPIHRPGYRPTHVRRIHVSVYHYPRGYHYRRWVSGRTLPRAFLSNAYYYDNWYDLGYGPPPHGYRWVRYGPDLLLVNLRTGRIVDVVYGVFY